MELPATAAPHRQALFVGFSSCERRHISSLLLQQEALLDTPTCCHGVLQHMGPPGKNQSDPHQPPANNTEPHAATWSQNLPISDSIRNSGCSGTESSSALATTLSCIYAGGAAIKYPTAHFRGNRNQVSISKTSSSAPNHSVRLKATTKSYQGTLRDTADATR